MFDNGEAALEFLLGNGANADVVILDVMLPGIDGFDVARELRKAGRFMPVLMLTALNRPEDVLRGFESGADDYLPKPFDLAILRGAHQQPAAQERLVRRIADRRGWRLPKRTSRLSSSTAEPWTFGRSSCAPAAAPSG